MILSTATVRCVEQGEDRLKCVQNDTAGDGQLERDDGETFVAMSRWKDSMTSDVAYICWQKMSPLVQEEG